MFVNSLAALNSRVPTSLPSRSSPNVTSTPKRTTARYVRRNSSQVGAIVLRVRVSSALELPVADCSCTYLSRHTRRGGCLLLLVCLVAWVCLCVHVDSIFGCRAQFVLFFPGDLRVWDCGRDVWPPAQTLFLAFVPAAPAAPAASPLFYVYLFIAGMLLTLLGAVAAVVYINNPVSGCFSFISFCFSCSSAGRSFSVLPRRGSVSF